MNRFILIFVHLVMPLSIWAQTVQTSTQKGKDLQIEALSSKIDSLLTMNNMLLEQIDIDMSLKNRYKLYQTDNIYTLLELDTKTGKIKQVQWSLESDNEFSVSINSDDLTFGYGYGSGSFELYPTKNMYQFILIDKTDGHKWHVQWGMESSKRWIRRMF
ncbi:MAG: hypothetical protein MJZ01_07070 [Bacteroidales bacterium]|nr:hypothetical protein [Bacteroidales bacterium]